MSILFFQAIIMLACYKKSASLVNGRRCASCTEKKRNESKVKIETLPETKFKIDIKLQRFDLPNYRHKMTAANDANFVYR